MKKPAAEKIDFSITGCALAHTNRMSAENFPEITAGFQIGVRGATLAPRWAPAVAPLPRRRRLRQEEPSGPLPTVSFDRPQRWLLVPAHHIPSPDMVRIFDFISYGLTPAYKAWSQAGSSPFPLGKFRLPKGISVPQIPYYMKEFANAMWSLIVANQRIRRLFKRLVQRWRVARLRQVNTEDVVTMEAPKSPIWVYDWTNRTKYVFEAATLFKGFRTSLTLSEGLFPTPQSPKNPFTNQPLSYAQVHFTMNALRATGFADWVTESYRAHSYDVELYRKRCHTMLRTTALKRLFADQKSEEYTDLLYDFIDFCHDNAEVEMERKDVWEWMIQNRPDYCRIQAWRSACYKYYHGLITEAPEKFAVTKILIQKEVDGLIVLPIVDMIILWMRAKSKS